METDNKLWRAGFAGFAAAILAAVLFMAGPSLAQNPGQYPGQYPGVYPGQYPGNYPGQFPNSGRGYRRDGQNPQAQFPQQSGQGIRAQLPDGVDQLYALEGDNSLLAMATPEGYDRLDELVRNLDGDLDIIQTKVVDAQARQSDIAALGVTIDPNNPSVGSESAGKLLAALQAGNLRATETLRITTREFTVVDTLLRSTGERLAAGGTPFSLIPRVAKNGAITLEVIQPVSETVSCENGQTAVIATPGTISGTVRLLFLTPTIKSSDLRPAH